MDTTHRTTGAVGCQQCRDWESLKRDKGFPTAGDTYCGDCGARSADVRATLRSDNIVRALSGTTARRSQADVRADAETILAASDAKAREYLREIQDEQGTAYAERVVRLLESMSRRASR